MATIEEPEMAAVVVERRDGRLVIEIRDADGNLVIRRVIGICTMATASSWHLAKPKDHDGTASSSGGLPRLPAPRKDGFFNPH